MHACCPIGYFIVAIFLKPIGILDASLFFQVARTPSIKTAFNVVTTMCTPFANHWMNMHQPSSHYANNQNVDLHDSAIISQYILNPSTCLNSVEP
jgi:hypothetical protein